jgi:hypothetical protein
MLPRLPRAASALLRLDPGENVLPVVAAVAADLDVRKLAGASRLADPRHRHGEHLRDV